MLLCRESSPSVLEPDWKVGSAVSQVPEVVVGLGAGSPRALLPLSSFSESSCFSLRLCSWDRVLVPQALDGLSLRD